MTVLVSGRMLPDISLCSLPATSSTPSSPRAAPSCRWRTREPHRARARPGCGAGRRARSAQRGPPQGPLHGRSGRRGGPRRPDWSARARLAARAQLRPRQADDPVVRGRRGRADRGRLAPRRVPPQRGRHRRRRGRSLRSVAAERGRSGLPHWIVLDEAHYFFGAGGASSADAVAQTGNTVLVTYRPSLIAPDLLDSIGAFILAQTTVEQERYFVDALLRARGPAELDVSAALRALESPRGGLLSRDDGGPGGRPSCRGPACPRTRFAPGETRPSNCRPEGILLPPSRRQDRRGRAWWVPTASSTSRRRSVARWASRSVPTRAPHGNSARSSAPVPGRYTAGTAVDRRGTLYIAWIGPGTLPIW